MCSCFFLFIVHLFICFSICFSGCVSYAMLLNKCAGMNASFFTYCLYMGFSVCNCCCWLSFFLSVSASLWPHTLSCDLCAGTQSQWTNVTVEHIKDNNKSGTGVSMCVSMCMWLHAYLVVSSLKIVSVNPRFVSTPKWVNVKVRWAWVCVSVCENGQFEYNALENAFAEWKPFYLNAYAEWRKQQQHQHKSSCEAVGWWG